VSDWFVHALRVRYQETDRMGVVYHANVLNWFEIGRTEWIRSLGVSYRKLEEAGLYLPVVEAEVRFHRPALYDDIVEVRTRPTDLTPTGIAFAYEIRRRNGESDGQPNDSDDGLAAGPAEGADAGELLASGRTRHAWLNARWKPCRLDRQAPEVYAVLERVCPARRNG